MRRFFLLAIVLMVPIQSALADVSWYVGAGGTITRLRTSDFVSTSGLNDGLGLNDTASSGEFSDSSLGAQVFAGVRFNENFALVVKYSATDDGEDNWTGSTNKDKDGDPITPERSRRNYDFDGEASIDGITIYLVQTLPLSNDMEFSLEVGWTDQDIDFDWNSSRISGPPDPDGDDFSGSISDDDSGFAVGGILRYRFTEHWAISGELEWLAIDFGDVMEKPLRFGLNAEYSF